MSVLLIPLMLLAAPARPTEGPAAREQARLCESRPAEEGLAACRRAIEMGLGPQRLEAVRELMARRLASLERWEELVEHFREEVALHPERAEAQRRLGSALLFAVDRPEEALGPLREAARLGTDGPEAQVLLGISTVLGQVKLHTALTHQATAMILLAFAIRHYVVVSRGPVPNRR